MNFIKRLIRLPSVASAQPPIDLSFMRGQSAVYLMQGDDTHRLYGGHSRQESLSYEGIVGRLAQHEQRRHAFRDESVTVHCWTFDANSVCGNACSVIEAVLLQEIAASDMAPLVLNKQLPAPDQRSPILSELGGFRQAIQEVLSFIPWDAPMLHVLARVQEHFESHYHLPWAPNEPLCRSWLEARPDALAFVNKKPDTLIQALGLG